MIALVAALGGLSATAAFAKTRHRQALVKAGGGFNTVELYRLHGRGEHRNPNKARRRARDVAIWWVRTHTDMAVGGQSALPESCTSGYGDVGCSTMPNAPIALAESRLGPGVIGLKNAEIVVDVFGGKRVWRAPELLESDRHPVDRFELPKEPRRAG